MKKSNIFSTLKSLSLSIGSGVLASVPFVLIFVFVTFPYIEEKIIYAKKNSIQTATEAVFNVLKYYRDLELSGALSTEKAQALAAEQIKALRYGENEYFWIHNLDLKMVMHPTKPSMNGTDISDKKDPTGKFLFAEMNKVVQANQQGFISYMWERPGTEKPQPKESYVKLFKDWKWVIGHGVYSDDVIAEVNVSKANNFKWFALAVIASVLISFGAGYLQFVRVIVPVQNIISDLTKETMTLMTTAQDLNETSEILGETSQQQSSSVQQTATSVVEINEMISKTSDSAKQSSEIAENTKKYVDESLRSLQDLNQTLGQITNSQKTLETTVDQSVSGLQDIVHIIKKVSDKTKVINDIVFQTKLLSFNASVEAARAGEYGKGFSVVAQEVGELAQMSGKASVEIVSIVEESNKKVQLLIEDIRSGLNSSIQEIKTNVNIGMDKSNDSLEKLEMVSQMATESSELAHQISIANSEQAKGSSEAAKALTNMEKTSNNIMSVVEKTDECAQTLLKQSEHLKELTLQLNKVVSSSSNVKLETEDAHVVELHQKKPA